MSQTVTDNPNRPLVTILLCAYNEAAVLAANLREIDDYLLGLGEKYCWEIIIVNDGSSDETGKIAENFAEARPHVNVIHHPGNRGLGQATRTGIAASHGDYVVTLDVDLSYDVGHIKRMLDVLMDNQLQIVLASPYMVGGRISRVPALRKFLSIAANKFLTFFAHGNLSTITCMVRAFEGDFIRSMDLRAVGMEVMPEVVYKAMILRARIWEVPAHLDWERQHSVGAARQSSMHILRHILATIVAGFFFRPFIFLVMPGILFLSISLYANVWGLIHLGEAYAHLTARHGTSTLTQALGAAFTDYPYTYVIGLLTLVISILLMGVAAVLQQSKTYFEELYHLAASIRKQQITESRSSDS